jgi:hypothetical protein
VANEPAASGLSHLQQRLLVVALEDRPQAAVDAWTELRPGLVLDDLEPGSFALLPLIYRNLARSGHDDPELPRLKGIYRRVWATNTLLVERTKESAEVLKTAGISALFVEGVALASRFYEELGLRPSALVDVLVADDDEASALVELARAGWTARDDGAVAVPGIHYLTDPNRHICRLRSRLAIDCVASGHDPSDAFLGDREAHSLGGADIQVPRPAEALFAVIVTNACRGNGPAVQWVVDAKMALNADIDWRRLVAIAGESRQILRLRDALEYLTSLPGRKPPAAAITGLDGLTVTKRERISYACTTGSIRGAGGLPTLFAEHLGATARTSALHTIATFPNFLRTRWRLTHTWLVPIAAGRRALRLLTSRRETT